MDQKYIVAIEISGTQVKGAVATIPAHPAGSKPMPTIDAIVAEDNNDSVQFGRVQNLVNATTYTNTVMRRLQNEPAISDGRICGCYVGLAGRSLSSEKTRVEIKLPSEVEITKEIVRELMAEATKQASVNKKVVKVLPRKFFVDSRPIGNPVGSMGQTLGGEFTLVVCDPINQRNLDLVLREKANLPVVEYVVTPLALADMVLGEEEKQLGCMLVDIGSQTTTISIYKDRSLQWLVTLPMGSFNITNDITLGLHITAEKAETMKCSQGNAMPNTSRQSDENALMNSYVAARAFEIVANINANINYANYRYTDLSGGIILCGRGSRLKNLDRLLEEQTKMKVRHATMPGNINFALNTHNVRPADFLSLLSIITNVGKRRNFVNCVEFKPQTPEIEIDEIDIPAAGTAPAQPVQPAQPIYTPAQAPAAPAPKPQPQTQPVTEEKVDEDETVFEETPEETPATTKPTGSRGLLAKLKERVTSLLTTELPDDDATLDDE